MGPARTKSTRDSQIYFNHGKYPFCKSCQDFDIIQEAAKIYHLCCPAYFTRSKLLNATLIVYTLRAGVFAASIADRTAFLKFAA